MQGKRYLCALLLLLLLAGRLAARDTESGKTSFKKIEDFTLRDFRGKEHSLSDHRKSRLTVVIFMGTGCPLAKLYGPRLADLYREFARHGVTFLAIDSNRQDTLAMLESFARRHEISFPFLKDPGNKVADLFGAERTPEAFILDGEWQVRYRGRIDDQYDVGYSRARPDHRFLARAIEELRDGKEVTEDRVEAVGCYIGKVAKSVPRGDVTYSRHVAPILNNRCVECHRKGEIAPFPLTTFKEVVGWADTIREVIEDQRMPPWHANPEYGSFANDNRLSEKEKKLIYAWVDDGASQGDPSDLPPPPEFGEGWRIPEPHLVLPIPRPFTVPAEGIVPYKYFMVDPGWKEGRWIKAAEARAGNPSVVHHILLFSLPPDQERGRIGQELALINSIATMAPGMPPTRFPAGMGKYVPAGSKLVFQVHYTPNGSEQRDRSYVGLIFAEPDEVKQEVKTDMAINVAFEIPPEADDHEVKASYRFPQNSRLISLMPHMHLRGKSFRYEAVFPDGRREVLLDVPGYDFNWQNTYVLSKPLLMPEGTVLHCRALFDNSEDNLTNPDPTTAVRFGEQTWEEMMIGAFDVVLEEQDLTNGAPRIKPLLNGKYEVTFRFVPDRKAKSVHLAGSFQDWNTKSLPMKGPDEKGAFTLVVQLGPGNHEYKYLIDGTIWKSDPGNRQQKGYYHNSLLRVGPRQGGR